MNAACSRRRATREKHDMQAAVTREEKGRDRGRTGGEMYYEISVGYILAVFKEVLIKEFPQVG